MKKLTLSMLQRIHLSAAIADQKGKRSDLNHSTLTGIRRKIKLNKDEERKYLIKAINQIGLREEMVDAAPEIAIDLYPNEVTRLKRFLDETEFYGVAEDWIEAIIEQLETKDAKEPKPELVERMG